MRRMLDLPLHFTYSVQSQWNLENRFTGWTDVPLSPKGIEEARAAGEKLKAYIFDRAYTSVLKRAIDTLDIIGQKSIPIVYEFNGSGKPISHTYM